MISDFLSSKKQQKKVPSKKKEQNILKENVELKVSTLR